MSATLPITPAEPELRPGSQPDRAQLAALAPFTVRGPRLGKDELEGVLRAFNLESDSVELLGAKEERGHRIHVVGPEEILVGRRFSTLPDELGKDSAFLLVLEGTPDERRLAQWRNSLWPLIHVGAVLKSRGGKVTKTTLGGVETIHESLDFDGAVLFGHRTTHVMSPEATTQKFDKNAVGWDGRPGSANYPHFRWMRRFVGHFVQPPPSQPEGRPLRVLDFGCGAGWVGIEAAKMLGNVELSSFDPSSEMVRIAEGNAEKEGVTSFTGRVGFGEAPPFDDQPKFDYVISSGVVSFSSDMQAWLDGLTATLAPGADLVIGDIHPGSKGFRRRRRRKPLLPVREMNAQTREAVREALEARGLVHVRSGAYQLTRPIPEAMFINETKLKGVLSYPLLWLNRVATFLDGSFGSPLQDRFDSWVMHFTAPEAATGAAKKEADHTGTTESA